MSGPIPREWRGKVTQEDTARALGMTRRHWHRIEHGLWPVPQPVALLMRLIPSAKVLLRVAAAADGEKIQPEKPGEDETTAKGSQEP